MTKKEMAVNRTELPGYKIALALIQKQLQKALEQEYWCKWQDVSYLAWQLSMLLRWGDGDPEVETPKICGTRTGTEHLPHRLQETTTVPIDDTEALRRLAAIGGEGDLVKSVFGRAENDYMYVIVRLKGVGY